VKLSASSLFGADVWEVKTDGTAFELSELNFLFFPETKRAK